MMMNLFPNVINHLLDDSVNYYTDYGLQAFGKANVVENESSYVLDFYVPGVDKKEIELRVTSNELEIKYEKKEEEKKYNFLKKEYNYNSFHRRFKLPKNVSEKVNAVYDNGILRVTIPKEKDEIHLIEIA